MPKLRLIWLLLPLAACAATPGDDATSVPEAPAVETTALEGADPATDPDAEPYDPAQDLTLITCGAHETLDLVGQPLDGALPRLPEKHRIIRPEDVVTQDYDTKRMNVFVDGRGTITKIDCG